VTDFAHRRYADDTGENPYLIAEDDPLLQRLFEVHGSRRYQELKVKKDRRLKSEEGS